MGQVMNPVTHKSAKNHYWPGGRQLLNQFPKCRARSRKPCKFLHNALLNLRAAWNLDRAQHFRLSSNKYSVNSTVRLVALGIRYCPAALWLYSSSAEIPAK